MMGSSLSHYRIVERIDHGGAARNGVAEPYRLEGFVGHRHQEKSRPVSASRPQRKARRTHRLKQ